MINTITLLNGISFPTKGDNRSNLIRATAYTRPIFDPSEIEIDQDIHTNFHQSICRMASLINALQFREPMCRLANLKSNKANSFNLYPKTKGYLRETCKSQNMNFISPTTNFNFDIIQIIIKSLLTILVSSSIKIGLCVQFQYLTFQPDKESGVCVRSKFLLLSWSILLSH